MRKLFSSLLVLLFSFIGSAQTFVGEVKTQEEYQYLKITIKDDSTFVSTPYEFRPIFKFGIKAKEGNSFTTEARAETRKYNFQKITDHRIELNTEFTGILQHITLKKLLEPISEDKMDNYTGNYVDDKGNRAVVYVRRGYLHLMTPYEEQTVSLKPIGENHFWSTSGESTMFMVKSATGFQQLVITNRNGEKVKLNRSFDYTIKENWLMVDGDSIYVNLFIPDLKGEKPACLLLPGGGGRSQMENLMYEARFFASHGMVAMTFDKASVGKSKGKSFEHYTFQEKAKRYQQLFNFLQSHEEVNSQKVGLHGPSEGGRLALMMGINLGEEIAFINTTAAPIMTMKAGQLYAVNHYSRNLGMTEEDVVKTLGIWSNYYEGIIQGKIDTTDFDDIRFLNTKYANAFLPPTNDVMPLSPQKEDLMDHTVVTEVQRLKCPIFLQYGENDQRVNPVASLQNFYQHISENTSVTAELYKRGNHSMMTPEYEICSGYAYDKVKWLKNINVIE